MQPVTDANDEAYRYVIDFSLPPAPVLCPNIHFSILFSHTLKVRNEILHAYEDDCPSGFSRLVLS
jgi:hypothetical protein